MPELELDPQKIYTLPHPLSVETVDDCFLIISSETANWLLLQNELQLEIFKRLSAGESVLDVIRSLPESAQADIYNVLVELEAKQFEDTTVQHPQEHGMYIYLTNRCNQRCKHCYMFAGEENGTELSLREITSVLKAFAQHGGNVVTFTGGEATLRPDFCQIADAAKAVGLTVGVLSNGLLWTQNLIDRIKGSVDEVQISIDGFDSDSYQSVRGSDSFDTALEAVDRLINAEIRVTVAITPLLETLLGNENKYIAFSCMLTEKYKGKELFIKFSKELLEGRSISPSDEDNKAYREAIWHIKSATATISEDEEFTQEHINNTILNNCGYGGLSIASNGDVYFCNLVSQCAKQASIRENSFDEIWALSEKARALSDINNLAPCKDCALKYLCGGGCRIKYFKRLTNAAVHTCGDIGFSRDVPCSREQKEKLLRLMVRANSLFYR